VYCNLEIANFRIVMANFLIEMADFNIATVLSVIEIAIINGDKGISCPVLSIAKMVTT
jgi:hypothetical protein